jgi:hypothetical protein
VSGVPLNEFATFCRFSLALRIRKNQLLPKLFYPPPLFSFGDFLFIQPAIPVGSRPASFFPFFRKEIYQIMLF